MQHLFELEKNINNIKLFINDECFNILKIDKIDNRYGSIKFTYTSVLNDIDTFTKLWNDILSKNNRIDGKLNIKLVESENPWHSIEYNYRYYVERYSFEAVNKMDKINNEIIPVLEVYVTIIISTMSY